VDVRVFCKIQLQISKHKHVLTKVTPADAHCSAVHVIQY